LAKVILRCTISET